MSLLSLCSARLRADRLERLSDAELAALVAPEVVQWLPAGFHAQGTTARRDFLAALSTQAEVVALRDRAGTHIGLLILSHPGPEKIRNLGYLFVRSAWGQGLASELIAALQSHFHNSDVVLSGGVMQENAASARVLQKAGFTAQPSADSAETLYLWQAKSVAG